MRRRETRKAPDMDVLAHHYLQIGLRDHPDAPKHVANVNDLENMPMLKLMRLAKEMGVDPNELIEATELEETERSRYSMHYPAFRGELEFDMTIAFLGQSVTRKAKVVYEHTPEWEYFDERKQAPYEGRNGTMYHLEILAVPEVYDDDDQPMKGKPYWLKMDDITHDDVVPNQMFHDLLDAVDEKRKVEDVERRRLAAAQKAAVKSTSKRKH